MAGGIHWDFKEGGTREDGRKDVLEAPPVRIDRAWLESSRRMRELSAAGHVRGGQSLPNLSVVVIKNGEHVKVIEVPDPRAALIEQLNLRGEKFGLHAEILTHSFGN
jgi:hypothetical protein